ncbi:MAG TPA: hypothetical protein VGG01_06500 [Xanthobacteraceae bacterium]
MAYRLLDAVRIVLLAGLTAPVLAPTAAFAQTQPNLTPDDQIAPRQVQTEPVVKPKPKPKPTPRAVQPAANPADASAPAATAAPAPKPRKPAPAANAVTCTGLFAKDSSHVKLAEFFQTQNIEYGQVAGSAGGALNATILFPKDPKRRLEVLWQNEAARSDIATIAITGQSQWKGPKGLRLGLALAALEKLNGKPFKLAGFDQPDGARALDWMGGALANLPGGCQVGLTFLPDRKAPANLVAAAAGKEVLSSDPAVHAVKPTVSEIILGYSQ